MSVVRANGVEIHYAVSGHGPWVTLSHALGADLSLWDAQVDALSREFTVLRYDTRGHGGSSALAGSYAFSDLVQDVLSLWDALGIQRSHFIGLSMGGMVGQQLALSDPARLGKLVLCSTTGSFAANREGIARLWEQRIADVTAGGMEAIAEATLARWYTEPFRCAETELMARQRAMIGRTSLAGYAGCGRMVADFDLLSQLGRITSSTLVMVGEDDAGTPPAVAAELARAIPGARLEVFPQASHCLNVEQAQLFNLMVSAFISR